MTVWRLPAVIGDAVLRVWYSRIPSQAEDD
jgi:hypothetical protein